jgi:hypothetical protein
LKRDGIFFIKFKTMKQKKFILLTLSLIVLFFASTFFASAAEFRFAKEGQNINVGEGERVENFYTVGNIVSIDGDVSNDLYTAGNVITIEGDVENNFAGAGRTVIIKGDVGNNAHIMGETVIIKGTVTEDLFIAGASVLIEKSAMIAGDLVIGAGKVDIEGSVLGDVYIGGNEVTLNGRIIGKTKLAVDTLKIGKNAEIVDDIKYTSSKKAQIHEDARVLAGLDFDKKALNASSKAPDTAGLLLFLLLLKIAACIVTGLVLVYFFNKKIKAVVTGGLKNVWGNIGVGFAVCLLTPVVMIILAVTVVGIQLAGLLLVLYIMLLALSSVIASIALGSFLIKVLKKKETFEVSWQEVVLGVMILKIVWFVPVIGWLLCATFSLLTMGSISKLAYKSIIKK